MTEISNGLLNGKGEVLSYEAATSSGENTEAVHNVHKRRIAMRPSFKLLLALRMNLRLYTWTTGILSTKP